MYRTHPAVIANRKRARKTNWGCKKTVIRTSNNVVCRESPIGLIAIRRRKICPSSGNHDDAISVGKRNSTLRAEGDGDGYVAARTVQNQKACKQWHRWEPALPTKCATVSKRSRFTTALLSKLNMSVTTRHVLHRPRLLS